MASGCKHAAGTGAHSPDASLDIRTGQLHQTGMASLATCPFRTRLDQIDGKCHGSHSDHQPQVTTRPARMRGTGPVQNQGDGGESVTTWLSHTGE